MANILLDGNFSTLNCLTGEEFDAADAEFHDTIAGGVNRKVTGQAGADAGALRQADLTDDDLADFDLLAAEQLNTEPLAGAIVDVFGGTASFHM
jgi:hypothetical protein